VALEDEIALQLDVLTGSDLMRNDYIQQPDAIRTQNEGQSRAESYEKHIRRYSNSALIRDLSLPLTQSNSFQQIRTLN